MLRLDSTAMELYFLVARYHDCVELGPEAAAREETYCVETHLIPYMQRRFSWDKCPTCGSDNLRKSHLRNVLERAASSLLIPCRCRACDCRFFRPRRRGKVERWAYPLSGRTRALGGCLGL